MHSQHPKQKRAGLGSEIVDAAGLGSEIFDAAGCENYSFRLGAISILTDSQDWLQQNIDFIDDDYIWQTTHSDYEKQTGICLEAWSFRAVSLFLTFTSFFFTMVQTWLMIDWLMIE